MTSRVAIAAFVLASAIFAAPIASAVTPSLAVPIDTTWRALGPVGDLTGQGINNVGLTWEASHVGWNTQLGFDDSAAAGWTGAIQVIHPNPPQVRYWVDGTETVGSSPAYFRKVFNLPGIPQNSNFHFNVDDDAKVYVNGQLVFSDDNSLATDDTFSVTSQLHSGLNLIAIKAQDQQGAQSIAGELNINYLVPEPSALLLFALAAAPLLRTRRC